MTEEERTDARQLAERNAKRAAAEYGDSHYVVALDSTLKGYVAACEAKRVQIEQLQLIVDLVCAFERGLIPGQPLKQAIAEYEAARV